MYVREKYCYFPSNIFHEEIYTLLCSLEFCLVFLATLAGYLPAGKHEESVIFRDFCISEKIRKFSWNLSLII